MSFIDIHSHILPGLDDGAADEAEFLAMSRAAVEGGTTIMVATPHWDLEERRAPWYHVPPLVEKFRKILAFEGLELELLPGAEIRLNAGLYRLTGEEAAVRRLTLAGNRRYILVDLPLADLPVGTEETLFRIQLCGCTPILAHPERNRRLAKDTALLRELAERGIELQVNSGSLTGTYGRLARSVSAALLSEGLARLMASDAHCLKERHPDLSQAWRRARDLLGEKAADALLKENPRAVLEGEDLLALPTRGGSRRRARRR